jgi:hypothetical protein
MLWLLQFTMVRWILCPLPRLVARCFQLSPSLSRAPVLFFSLSTYLHTRMLVRTSSLVLCFKPKVWSAKHLYSSDAKIPSICHVICRFSFLESVLSTKDLFSRTTFCRSLDTVLSFKEVGWWRPGHVQTSPLKVAILDAAADWVGR